MSKFTKGPWLWSEQVKPETGVVFGVFPIQNDGSRWICRLIADGKSDLKKVRANAALIAAAPEMFALLKSVQANRKLLNDEHFSGVSEKLFAMIAATLSKAEGRE